MIFRSIEAGLNSNVGCKRKNNQDNALASRGVYVVCDGMGGGKGGERASAQVAACFSQLAEQPSRNRTSIEHALSQSQQQVLELGQELGGIAGTTITGVVLRLALKIACMNKPSMSTATSSMSEIHAPTICAPMRKAIGWRSR